jgi:hypothetical protein
MQIPTWLGFAALVLLALFVAFAFRQGMKVKKPPEGVPPEQIGSGWS